MASKYGNDDDAISEINVVPLVDIILVVLIIFMVTAPMIMQPSINVNLPQAASGDETVPSQLNITMAADGQIFLNGSVVSQDDITAIASAEYSKNPDVQAIISADRDVPHGRVISTLDIVKSVGVKKFAITIEKSN